MTLKHMRQTLTLIACLSTVVAGCSGGAGRPPPDVIFDFTGDAGVAGCTQPSFPGEQPDISPVTPPGFVTDTGELQRRIRPGQELRAEITVNGATRKVLVELSDAWAPGRVILTEDLDTTGNQTIPVSFFPGEDIISRFYMRLTLCGVDCDEREVVFDIIDYDPDMPAVSGVNADYERTVIEEGDVVQVDQTCVRTNSVLIQ
jgi:hypothetical protein